MAGSIDGVALASIAAGGLFVYAGIKGKSVLGSVQTLIKGGSPSSAPTANQITGTGTGDGGSTGTGSGSGSGGSGHGVSGGTNEATLKATAATFGWTDANGEWQALYNVEMREAGFSLTATNPSSGAYGMAQFINGPSEYYQYGGDPNTAAGQSVAMCNYIKQRYGRPSVAWAHEQANNWY